MQSRSCRHFAISTAEKGGRRKGSRDKHRHLSWHQDQKKQCASGGGDADGPRKNRFCPGTDTSAKTGKVFDKLREHAGGELWGVRGQCDGERSDLMLLQEQLSCRRGEYHFSLPGKTESSNHNRSSGEKRNKFKKPRPRNHKTNEV